MSSKLLQFMWFNCRFLFRFYQSLSDQNCFVLGYFVFHIWGWYFWDFFIVDLKLMNCSFGVQKLRDIILFFKSKFIRFFSWSMIIIHAITSFICMISIAVVWFEAVTILWLNSWAVLWVVTTKIFWVRSIPSVVRKVISFWVWCRVFILVLTFLAIQKATINLCFATWVWSV